MNEHETMDKDIILNEKTIEMEDNDDNHDSQIMPFTLLSPNVNDDVNAIQSKRSSDPLQAFSSIVEAIFPLPPSASLLLNTNKSKKSNKTSMQINPRRSFYYQKQLILSSSPLKSAHPKPIKSYSVDLTNVNTKQPNKIISTQNSNELITLFNSKNNEDNTNDIINNKDSNNENNNYNDHDKNKNNQHAKYRTDNESKKK